jgi:hypothetical protein
MAVAREFYPSATRVVVAFAWPILFSLSFAAYGASLDVQQALDLITNTADKICNVVSTRGEAESSAAKGEIKAQLGGLAAKLADVGVSGSGSITSDQYQNVLRQDLGAALQNNATCKLKVFDTLQAKLLSLATPPQIHPDVSPASLRR